MIYGISKLYSMMKKKKSLVLQILMIMPVDPCGGNSHWALTINLRHSLPTVSYQRRYYIIGQFPRFDVVHKVYDGHLARHGLCMGIT